MKLFSLCLASIGLLSLATSSFAAEKITANDLKQIGLAYHNYFDVNKKGPEKAEDLTKYLGDKKDAVKRLVDLLKDEEIVFAYKVGIFDMVDGTSNTVLAYVKSVPADGGLVLYADGSVKTLKAADFKKATIAKPKKS